MSNPDSPSSSGTRKNESSGDAGILSAIGMLACIAMVSVLAIALADLFVAYYSGELGCHCTGACCQQEAVEPLPPSCSPEFCPPGLIPPPRVPPPRVPPSSSGTRNTEMRVPFDLPLRELHPISMDLP